MKKYNLVLSLLLLTLLSIISCTRIDYTPKPRGFFRIKFPEKNYSIVNNNCPYRFEIPDYSSLNQDYSQGSTDCWKNLDFPAFNAKLHISYFQIGPDATLDQLTEDARTFAFKHSSKAAAIDQIRINRPHKDVYGLTYFIKGNTASNIQFFVTDSSNNYLRAALYFNEKPNLDSIQPILDFIHKDIDHIIDTFEWK